MMECTISYIEVCYIVNRLALSFLYSIAETPDSCLTQLWIFIHHAYAPTTKSQSRYKSSFYVSFISSFSMCTFQPIITFHLL